ncbi:MAG: metabolite traffic protein EboE [Planctomycetaceae bacterium]|nr:metabolite traffic protein EboE [Planctomycetaceae bacterium]
MTLSTLPLSYCTNVHPGLTVDEVCQGLVDYAGPIQKNLEQPLAAGLWLAEPVIDELRSDARKLGELKQTLSEQNLVCYTLNAFPYGNFHSERVKEQVYVPDWSEEDRLTYTHECAKILAELMDDFDEGSISTVPLGFKQLVSGSEFRENCIDNLLQLAMLLDQLYQDTGKRIRLAIEPEPLCILETTAETIDFFQELKAVAIERDQAQLAREYLGVCYDVCHQAVEFEDVAESLKSLDAVGIRINKVHITCAINLDDPGNNPAGRKLLAEFVEPRYLHQTFALFDDGNIRTITDLSEDLCHNPPPHMAEAIKWRIHFHVPVDADDLGPLGTTRDDLKIALQTVAQLDQTPHLEVETYTWSVMPGEEHPSLVDGFTAELKATLALLQSST